MRFKEILLVIVLILAGAAVYEYQTGGFHFNFDGEDGFFGAGKEYSAEETQTYTAPLPARLEVRNGHGFIDVRGTDEETIRLTFKKRVWRRTEDQAKEVAGRLRFVLEKSGDVWTLSTNREEFDRKNFETGFVLTVPRHLAVVLTNSYGAVVIGEVKDVQVRNRHGEVTARDIEGNADLETTYEDLEARNIKGECRVVNAHADIHIQSVEGGVRIDHRYGTVRAEDLAKTLEVDAEHAEIDARRVQGTVSVDTSYEKVILTDVGGARVTAVHAPVEADNVRGSLDVQTTYEPVKVSGVTGDLIVRGKNASVTASDIGGQAITIDTSYEDIEVSGFSAKTIISLHNAHIVLKPSDLRFGMDIRNSYGDIELVWPAGADSPVDAQSKGGNVHWGLAVRPDLEQSNGTSVVKAFSASAGKAPVVLATSHGDIRIVQ
jgi:DUF4097 and DUF4098 domain-containing protein YvlB